MLPLCLKQLKWWLPQSRGPLSNHKPFWVLPPHRSSIVGSHVTWRSDVFISAKVLCSSEVIDQRYKSSSVLNSMLRFMNKIEKISTKFPFSVGIWSVYVNEGVELIQYLKICRGADVATPGHNPVVSRSYSVNSTHWSNPMIQMESKVLRCKLLMQCGVLPEVLRISIKTKQRQ